MKYLLKLSLFLMAVTIGLTAVGQEFYVKGYVNNGNDPAEGIDVRIAILHENNQPPQFYDVVTDVNGNYKLEAKRNPAHENQLIQIKASLANCNGVIIYKQAVLRPGENEVSLDLEYCSKQEQDSCSVKIVLGGNSGLNEKILRAKATGNAPFQYLWSDGSTTETVHITENRQYCVTVVAADGCRATDCFEYSNDKDSCSVRIIREIKDGKLYLTAIGNGVAPFQYKWSDGTTSQTIEASPGANYCVILTDVKGCVAKDCLFPDTNLPCKVKIVREDRDSIVYLRAESEGVAPFTYLWSDGSTTQTIIAQPNTQYCVTMTDANGCSAKSCFSDHNPQKCAVVIRRSLDNSGNIYLIAVAKGEAPFSYLWSDGSTDEKILFEHGKEYCVTITDSTGCTVSACLKINPNIPCKVHIAQIPGNGGTELVAIINIPGNVKFEWSTGEITSRILVTTPGIYCVTVTYPTGCEAKACITVRDSSNKDCPQGHITVEYNSDRSEAKLSFLSLTNGNYHYEWSTGETTDVITVLQSGIYYLTVTDPERPNCKSVFKVIVQLKECAAKIVLRPTDSIILLTVYPLPPNAQIDKILWSTGEDTQTIAVLRGAGEYCVTITYHNCTATTCITLGPKDPRRAIQEVTLQNNFSELQYDNGHLDDSLLDFVVWNTGAFSPSIVPLHSGTYSLNLFFNDGTVEELSYEFSKKSSSIKNNSQDQLKLYPNPVLDRIRIELQDDNSMKGSFQIFSLNGVLISQQVYDNITSSSLIEFSTADLMPGIYIARLIYENGFSIGKFIKQ
jgi:hypothetical protein